MANLIYPQGSIGSAGQLGLSWATFFDDFVGGTTIALATLTDSGMDTTAVPDIALWTKTLAATGTASTPETGSTGELLLFGTSAADIVSVQPNGGPFILAPGKRLIAEIRCKVQNITTDTDELFGLAPNSALPLLTTGLPLNSNFIGFVKTGATANIDAITQTATASKTTTSAVATFAADTYKIFRIEWDGVERVRFIVDGVLVATHNANIPASTALLKPTLALQTIDAGAADFNFTIDYFLCMAQR